MLLEEAASALDIEHAAKTGGGGGGGGGGGCCGCAFQ